jgi:dipeptidyl-peptidase III
MLLPPDCGAVHSDFFGLDLVAGHDVSGGAALDPYSLNCNRGFKIRASKSKIGIQCTFRWRIHAWKDSGMKGRTVTEKRMVGELERLGKNGQDFIVLGLDAPGFAELTPDQKKLAYYLYRAAIAGHTLVDQQNHRHALEIRTLLETLCLHSEGMPAQLREAVLDYLKYIWINHGPYDHDAHVKTLPNYLTREMLRQAAEWAEAQGARFEFKPGETLPDKLERLGPTIFDPNFEPIMTNQKKGDDIIATSSVNLYDRRLTQQHIDALPSEWHQRLNVRFGFENGRAVPQVYRIGGLYGADLQTIVHFLRLALPYAEGDEQQRGLQELMEYYQTGDEERFRQYSIAWLRSDTEIDYLNGFIESYMDPRGVVGQFEGNVSFVSDSTLIGRLADHALYFEMKMPWPDVYKLDKVNRPIANVVNVIVETGDSGPTSPAAYNLPNYNDLRRDYGSKNIILLNIEQARSEKIREQMIDEFYLPEYRDLVRTHGDKAREWEVYMHEVIGHGSGRPDAALTVDPAVAIGRAYSALEECRADLVALYHAGDSKLVEIGAFRKEEQSDIVKAMYIAYLQGQLNRYRMYEDDYVREAHQRGQQLVLGFLLEGGEHGAYDYGVRVIQKDGNFYARLADQEKAHKGIGHLLGILQVYKATGDASAATHIFDRFGTRVNPEWRLNIRQRAAKLKIPNKSAFVFPRLEAVMAGAEIVDVKLHVDEDLATQQLRMSRLRLNTKVPE